MARSGVRPLSGRGERSSPPQKRAPAPSTPTAAPAVAPTGGPASRPAVPPPRPAAPARGARPEDVRAELWAELERLRAEVRARAAQLHDASAEASALRAERDDLEQLSRRQERELRALMVERQALRDDLAATRADRDEVSAHRASLQRAMERLQSEAPERSASARALLEARGLVGDSELDLILRGLGDLHEGAGLIELLSATDVEAAQLWLEDRVALVCASCTAAPGRAVLSVPPARCDVCGGSDIRRAVRRFQDAALLSGLGRVVIVGGSPQYHRQLRALVNDPRITLNLIPGDRRRTSRQVAADEAGADLVIVWGATMLDHSLSQLYGRHGGRVITIPHRGIARMLERATEALT